MTAFKNLSVSEYAYVVGFLSVWPMTFRAASPRVWSCLPM